MPSYQRIAMFVIFDSMERDLIFNIRQLIPPLTDPLLTDEEIHRARNRIKRRKRDNIYDMSDPHDLLHGLDLGDKYTIMMRFKTSLSSTDATYFSNLKPRFDRAIAVRSDVAHGRPLIVDDYTFGFSFANELLRTPRYWPELAASLKKINDEPLHLLHSIPPILD